jgi:anti-sigma B factor antagonist
VRRPLFSSCDPIDPVDPVDKGEALPDRPTEEVSSLRAPAQVEVEVLAPEASTGAPVIAIRGEVDLSNAASVQSEIDEILGGDVDRVVLDLDALTFIDSSGIAVLVRLHNRVGSVQVRNPTAVVRRIIKVTGLDEVLGLGG